MSCLLSCCLGIGFNALHVNHMLDHDEEETYMDDYRNTIDKLINLSVDPNNKKNADLVKLLLNKIGRKVEQIMQ